MIRQLHIAICEDSEDDAQRLSEMIKQCGLICDIALFSSAESLLCAPSIANFDLFLFDIYLGGMTGIELARRIRANNIDCEIVFTTSSDAHALEGFEVSALQYLLKPVTSDSVADMLDRFIKIRDRRDLNYCTVLSDKAEINIFYRDIYYIESSDKYCKIVTGTACIETYSTLAAFAGKLPDPPFLHCHRSYIVNMAHIGAAGNDFIMKNGAVVYIRRTEKKEIIKRYTDYLIHQTREGSS